MIDILISCAFVGVVFFLFVLFFGAQMERHLHRSIKHWADEAEKKEASK